MNSSNKTFEINFKAKNNFIKDAVGSPFTIYARNYLNNDFTERNYALIAGDEINDAWNISDFKNNNYHLHVYAPNGFFRIFKGDDNDAAINISLIYHTDLKNNLTGNIQFKL